MGIVAIGIDLNERRALAEFRGEVGDGLFDAYAVRLGMDTVESPDDALAFDDNLSIRVGAIKTVRSIRFVPRALRPSLGQRQRVTSQNMR